MKADQVIVKNSTISGKGTFALRDFKKGEVVIRWDVSKTLPKEQVDQMSNEEKKYISFLNNQYIITQEPEKYINHSCEANVVVVDFCYIALKDIKKGEEITSNYNEELVPGSYMTCNCGSKVCKKIILS